MIVRAHITYKNDFEMEVPDNQFDLDDAKRFRAIVEKDEYGEWDTWSEEVEENKND